MRNPLFCSLCVLLVFAAPARSGAAAPQSPTDLAKLEREFEKAQAAYLEALAEYLPGAYEKHFAALRPKELQEVAQIRRLWQFYIEEGPTPMGDPRKQKLGIFRNEFLRPMDRMAELLLIDPESIKDRKAFLARARAMALGKRLMRARERAKVDIDPTKDKKAPTGLAYPRLDRPHTCIDRLRLFERSMILAKTVAPDAAEDMLMRNAELCAEVDVVEAGFVMYANQVRMLSGSIAWIIDPLMSACTRDHSEDLVHGRANAHQSKVPGKRFPRDRARRFGCRSGPEGVGGGRDGKAQIYGFSYNGSGHGGPLFCRLRNVAAPGRRKGRLTAMYQTENRLRHDCQATAGELFLPPGVSKRDLKTGATSAAYRAFQKQRFVTAYKALTGSKPKSGFIGAIHRYLRARLEAEVEWTLTGIERIAAAGDVFEAHRRLADAIKAMKGIPSFDRGAPRLEALLSRPAVKKELEVGRLYQHILEGRNKQKGMQALIVRYPRSPYAAAARYYLDNPKGTFPELLYFVLQDTHLNKWAYLRPARLGKG